MSRPWHGCFLFGGNRCRPSTNWFAWHIAAGHHRQQLRSVVNQFTQALWDSQAKLAEPPRQPIPSLWDLFLELQHVHAEFDKVTADHKKKYLAVQTDAIVLKGTYLGRFSLHLRWPRLVDRAGAECFDIVALDPHPSSLNEDVTHPHVKDQTLCAGDATMPLEKALEQGRLTDAFQLVRSVLETYNPHSVHVSLDDWDATNCWECGCCTDTDDRYCCDCCDHDVCSDCTLSCPHCGLVRCRSCQTRCGACKEPCCSNCLKVLVSSSLRYCPSCRSACVRCDAEVGTNELDEETGLCPACLKAQPNPEAVTAVPSSHGESS
jgi:hypothetical protein